MMARKKNRLKPLDYISEKTRYSYGGPNPVRLQHNMAYLQYRNMLLEWVLARFDWHNLPTTVDERHLEMCLIRGQLVTFYEDRMLGAFLAPKATTIGAYNLYENPTRFRTIAMGKYRSVELTSKNCVPIFGSFSRVADLPTIEFYAHQLAETSISLSVTRQAMRISRIVVCGEGQRLTYQNLMRDIEDGRPIVFGTDALDLDAISTLDMRVDPDTVERLRLEMGRIYNEAATAFGIENNTNDKTERLVSDEVSYDAGKTMAARNSALRARQEAAERINAMFGLNIEVRWSASPVADSPVNLDPVGSGEIGNA